MEVITVKLIRQAFNRSSWGLLLPLLTLFPFFLAQVSIETGLLLDVQDDEGKTALHYVVTPLNFGSYENTDLLRFLVEAGARIDIKDKDGGAL